MIVFQIINEELIIYQINGAKPFLIKKDELLGHNIIEPNSENTLVWDYNSYFNLERRKQFLIKYPFLEQLAFHFSPQEAIGGYLLLQQFDSESQRDFRIIDCSSGELSTYIISLKEKEYYYKCQKDSIQITELVKSILRLSNQQLFDFEEVLNTIATDGSRYGQIIKTALTKYEEGDKEYNTILEILDLSEWAHIKMADLVNLRLHIHKFCEISEENQLFFTGWLGFLFANRNDEYIGLEKIYGAMHLLKNRHQFYPQLQTDISLGVFCYPNWIKVPVLESQCDYPNYSVPKSLTLVDTGSIEIYRGEERLSVKTGQKLEHIQLEISLDGNQNLLLVAGKEIHLIT